MPGVSVSRFRVKGRLTVAYFHACYIPPPKPRRLMGNQHDTLEYKGLY